MHSSFMLRPRHLMCSINLDYRCFQTTLEIKGNATRIKLHFPHTCKVNLRVCYQFSDMSLGWQDSVQLSRVERFC